MSPAVNVPPPKFWASVYVPPGNSVFCFLCPLGPPCTTCTQISDRATKTPYSAWFMYILHESGPSFYDPPEFRQFCLRPVFMSPPESWDMGPKTTVRGSRRLRLCHWPDRIGRIQSQAVSISVSPETTQTGFLFHTMLDIHAAITQNKFRLSALHLLGSQSLLVY